MQQSTLVTGTASQLSKCELLELHAPVKFLSHSCLLLAVEGPSLIRLGILLASTQQYSLEQVSFFKKIQLHLHDQQPYNLSYIVFIGFQVHRLE